MNIDQFTDPLFAANDDMSNAATSMSDSPISEVGDDSTKTGSSSSNFSASPASYNGGNSRFVLKCLVPERMAGSVIGKGGVRITKIQNDSGARVKISRHGVLFPGTRDRILMIFSSDPATIISAFELVLTQLYQDQAKEAEDASGAGDADQDALTELRVLVPSSCAGIIIGKGGVVIKDVMSKSGANVKLSNKRDMVPGILERMVIVRGTLHQQIHSMKLIFNIMHADAECSAKSVYVNSTVEYNNGGYYGRGSSRGRSSSSRGGGGGGGYGGDSHLLPPYGSDSFHRSPNLYGNLPPMSMGGQHMRGDESAAHLSSALYGNPVGHDASLMGSAGVTRVTESFPIPDALVGAVIGQGGRAIGDIMKLSGTRVHISRRGEYWKGTRDRYVEITGPPDACATARRLIEHQMDIARHKRLHDE